MAFGWAWFLALGCVDIFLWHTLRHFFGVCSPFVSPTSNFTLAAQNKHCCCCCSSLVFTWNMIIHYTSFKILKGKREKRKRQERTKNGEGKYKETTLTQLYLMQIASDFSFKIFFFFFCLSFFFFPVSCVLRMMLPLWKRENLLHVRRYRFSFCSSVVDFFVFEKKQNI